MKQEFWNDRWQRGRTGFHRRIVHPDLIKHADALLGAPGGRVLVPLCGKSLDLGWLVARGQEVVGVEFSEEAARLYHETAGITPEITVEGALSVWRSPGLAFYVGDFFELDIGKFDAIWDRAALVALPPQIRPRYAARLAELLAPGGRLLMNCVTYDQDRVGPPHSITDAEVRRHYSELGKLTRLSDVDRLGEEPRWQASGMNVLREKVWFLQR